MTKEQIKLVLNIIRPAIRALTGEQKIELTGYEDITVNTKDEVRFGIFFVSAGNGKKYQAMIYNGVIDALKEI
jgi:hypothetical protein